LKMVLGLCVSLLSYLALLSNALSDHDFFAGDKCQQQGADQNPDQNDLLVKIDTGCVEGTRLSGTRIFRGIPYASPPVGNLRWRPPQPHKPWVSTLNAANFRSTCFQSVWRENKSLPVEGMWPSIQGVTNMSEDCLFMNVLAPSTGSSFSQCAKGCEFDLKQPYPYRGVCSDNKNISCSCLNSPNKTVCGPPLTKPSKGFPVMVYIHAGEFQYGSSNDLESNKAPQLPTDVVLVTFNYRIAALGYLGGDALRDRSPSGSTGNYGQQDQRFALQWVQRNIAQFGGDPDNVALFGESSGATSVAWHLTSNRSKGLFHKAILESPGLGQTHSMAESSTNFAYFAGSLAANHKLTDCKFDTGVWQNFSCQIMDSWHHEHQNIIDVTSVQQAEELCARNASCMGFDYPTHREPGKTFQARISTSYNMNQYYCDPRYTTQLKGVSMAKENFPNVQKCLLSAPAELISELDALVPLTDTITEDQWAPVVDGVETVVSVEKAIQNNNFHSAGVPVVLGSNLDEGSTFMSDTPYIRTTASAYDFERWAAEFAGARSGIELSILYEPKNLKYPRPHVTSKGSGDHYLSAVRAAGDRSITCPTYNMAQRLSQAGHRVFAYSFTITPYSSVNVDQASLRQYGAFHGAEVPFVFGDPSELLKPAERKVSAAMGCYWTNFAWNSDPNVATGRAALYSQKLCAKLMPWELTSQSNHTHIVFNTTGEDARIGMAPPDSLADKRCDFWGKLDNYNTDS